jgi:hypothetical protein
MLPDCREIDIMRVLRVPSFVVGTIMGSSYHLIGRHRSPNNDQGGVVENAGTSDLHKKRVTGSLPPFSLAGALDKVVRGGMQSLTPVRKVTLG